MTVSIFQNDSIVRGRAALVRLSEQLSWLPPALARVTVGIVFATSGWGKVQNLEKVTEFFTSLNIPMPALNAYFVSSLELVGGVCLIAGFLSRLFAIPLIGTMVVAILTAKLDEVEGIDDLVGLSEFAYLVLLAWIAIAGPGKLSIDHLLSKKLFKD